MTWNIVGASKISLQSCLFKWRCSAVQSCQMAEFTAIWQNFGSHWQWKFESGILAELAEFQEMWQNWQNLSHFWGKCGRIGVKLAESGKLWRLGHPKFWHFLALAVNLPFSAKIIWQPCPALHDTFFWSHPFLSHLIRGRPGEIWALHFHPSSSSSSLLSTLNSLLLILILQAWVEFSEIGLPD